MALFGNLLMGTGVSLLRISGLGNDAFTAMVMSLSEISPFDLAIFQILVNLTIIAIPLIWGRKYVGFGTLVTMFLLGYVVQYLIPILEGVVGVEGSHSFPIQVVIMICAITIISIGITIYQRSDAGIAPFDYLSIGLTEKFKNKYFINRICTDAGCVLLALMPFVFGMKKLGDCHIGISTLCCVFLFGPLVGMFDKIIFTSKSKDVGDGM